MPYAEPEDLPKIWHKVLTTNLTPDEVTTFIDHADNLINAALARRYAVPFTGDPNAAPPLIRQLSATLAFIEVIDRSPGTPEWLLRKIERAQELLKMLADGELTLPGIVEVSAFNGVRSSTEDYVPTFGVASSITERVDPDRITADESERTPE